MNCFNLDSYLAIYNVGNKEAMYSFLKLTGNSFRRLRTVNINNENYDLFCLSDLLSEKLISTRKI